MLALDRLRRPFTVVRTVSTPESGSKLRSWPIIVPSLRTPPVARDERAHDAVAAAAVPEQDAARLEHSRELADDLRVVARDA